MKKSRQLEAVGFIGWHVGRVKIASWIRKKGRYGVVHLVLQYQANWGIG